MSFDSLVNRGDYFSAHYLAEVLPKDLKAKDGLFARWTEQEKAGHTTPRRGLRALGKTYFAARPYFAELDARLCDGDTLMEDEARELRKELGELHSEILRALGYEAHPRELSVKRAGRGYSIHVAYADQYLVAIECGWSADVDAALDENHAGRLLHPVPFDNREQITSGAKLASWLFTADSPPRYVLLLAGGVIILADRSVWGEGRYLAVNLDVALSRNNADELGTIAALFGADSLLPPEEGGSEPLADLLAKSRNHAVGVSKELRDGLRESVELIANEVLDRIRAQGVQPEDIMEPGELAKELGREALRYLYRILFLLYAEARPELGILPVNDENYIKGYSMARLGELVVRDLTDEEARNGFHLYESLDLLFRMVNKGHRPRTGDEVSEDEGLQFEPLRSDLFEPEAIRLIGRDAISLDEDDPNAPRLDTRLRNEVLHKVLRKLMLTKGRKKERGGFISYAQLGINQLGAVYEGLMSYTGFIAKEELYEVAKGGDPSEGSWMIPASKVSDYPPEVFVRVVDEDGNKTDEYVRYRKGSFVYRLAGRDRETSASYYTPESLTKATVQLALKHRLDQDGKVTSASEILEWKICEPALGSGAFLNEAINQVAAEYLKRRQQEVGISIDPESYEEELQKVKAYIALHNAYGVDLNESAVELAEVSIWLNVMYPGLQAPWFGLHLRRGNSLIGAARRVYSPESLIKGTWLKETPEDFPFSSGPLPKGKVHHFLLPAEGWGLIASAHEAKELAPAEAKRLAEWRKKIRKRVSDKKSGGWKQSQLRRLQSLSKRVEYLWDLVQQRLSISEVEISRRIPVWGADWLEHPDKVVSKEKIYADLTAPGTPYWRLKKVMDTWCALWFWPVERVGLLDGSDEIYARRVLAAEPNRSSVERIRPLIPLANLDDWLDFAEAVLGRVDVPEDSLASFATLADLEEYENELPLWMGMDSELKLADRFPWLQTAEEISSRLGFFHWELEFAQIFKRGGFDLQVGNPPWVRPRWEEASVLAEIDPWFVLTARPSVSEWTDRKSDIVRDDRWRIYYTRMLAEIIGISEFLASPATYPLLVGTQPDLYRAFMCKLWENLGPRGIGGLIHPDTHFSGAKEGQLRAAVYRHLRFHAHFSNRYQLFDIEGTRQFSVNIYGAASTINFVHISWLFHPSTLLASLEHDGQGELPGIKYAGKWELRPHRERLIRVDASLLAQWGKLSGTDSPVEETPLLYPVTTAEAGAIGALVAYKKRLIEANPRISPGYHEANAKKDGLIRWHTGQPQSLDDVILQGPHLSQATPYSKQPNIPCKTNRDWSAWDLVSLAEDAVPRTNYERAASPEKYLAAQDEWTMGDGTRRRCTEFYRLAWRRMIPFDTERSLFAAIIPPGPAHVDGVHTLALSNNRETALAAGFWAALPLDYLLRISGRSDLRNTEVYRMPAAHPEHPLAAAVLLRTLRLNCLTRAYAALWEELFDPLWNSENWSVPWPGLTSLGDPSAVKAEWTYNTPLRTEFERRAALVELDVLVALWLGITLEQLIAIFRSRYPVLADYEAGTFFDLNGRKIAANHNAYGNGQTRAHFDQLMAHLDPEVNGPIPDGYVGPFYKANREAEYRQAYAVFSERLRQAGWPVPDDAATRTGR
ncbi:Eco57I restriction-modification methylase domain-containing protein [uncultured Thermomonospora sp.]|uniref:Eco57I restriction-modification methylase domain-containing protein n=1 Tax=uncultured Thermomonospora sp. TaxID=671175 RepID=UPI00259BC22C|nr:class I SAM-dependent DNA methyltransferase [uncultured Thermomonospora sp.]